MKNNKLFGALTIALLLNAWNLQGMNKAESPKKIKISNSALDGLFVKKNKYGDVLFNDALHEGMLIEHEYPSSTGLQSNTYEVEEYETFNARKSVARLSWDPEYGYNYADYVIKLSKKSAAVARAVSDNKNRERERVIYATNIGLRPYYDSCNTIAKQGPLASQGIEILEWLKLGRAKKQRDALLGRSFTLNDEFDLFDNELLGSGRFVIITESVQPKRGKWLQEIKGAEPKGKKFVVQDDTNVQMIELSTTEDQRLITLLNKGNQQVITQNPLYKTVENFSELVTLKQVRQADLLQYGKYSILERTTKQVQKTDVSITKEPTHLTYGLISAAVATAVVGVAWKLYSLFKAS